MQDPHDKAAQNVAQLRRSRDLAYTLNAVIGDGWTTSSVASTVPKLIAQAFNNDAHVALDMYDVRSDPADDAIYYYEARYMADGEHTGAGDTPLAALVDLRNKWRNDLAELTRKVDAVSACLPDGL